MVRRALIAFLLGTTAFCAPVTAQAGPLATAVALIGNGVSFSAAIGAAFGISSTLVSLAGAVLFSYVSSLLAPKPKAQDLKRELATPTSLPPYRFVYGDDRAVGSEAPFRVKGKIGYGCWILNSRPSAGPFTLFLDQREVESTGDPYDFSVDGGAVATNDPFAGYLKYWIGRGDQTSPPAQILAEAGYDETSAPDLFQASDAWQGQTVIWMRLDAGPNDNRADRWPSAPPLVEVDGQWSLVFDPRNPAHDLADPETWEYSGNHALCVLDALTQNPIRQYRAENLLLPFFEWGADVCDEAVALKDGGDEPRYTVAGTLIFSAQEIEDQVGPLMRAGAADFTRGGGRLGYVPGVYRAPSYTLEHLIGDQFEYSRLRRGRDLATQVRCTYTSRARGFETAELAPWDIPGAQAEDGGVAAVVDLQLDEFVTSPTQAMRVRNIHGRKLRRQRSLSGVAPPDAFDVIPGASVTVDLPAPFSALNGLYETVSVWPAESPMGDDSGVALRCPISLIETSPAIWGWNAGTDEEDVFDEDIDPTPDQLPPGGPITVTVEDVDSGGAIMPRFRISFAPSPSAQVVIYEVQVRVGAGDWQQADNIRANRLDSLGVVLGFVSVLSATEAHSIRVRASSAVFGSSGTRVSEWVEVNGLLLGGAVTVLSSTGGEGEVTFTGTMSTSRSVRGLRVYSGPEASDFGDADLARDTVDLASGASFAITVDGIDPGTADYWIVPVSQTGTDLAPQGPITLTVT